MVNIKALHDFISQSVKDRNGRNSDSGSNSNTNIQNNSEIPNNDEEIMELGGTAAEQVEQKLQKQQAKKNFKDIGRVSNTKKERSAYKLISGSILSTLEDDAVMAFNMVKKDNVWPEISIEEEKNRGITAGATYLKVKIREAVPTRPKDEKGKRATYVLFLELLQKDLLTCFTVEQIYSLATSYKNLPMDKIIGYFINPEFLTADQETKNKIESSLKENKNIRVAFMYGGSVLVTKLINEVFGSRFENTFFNKSDASHVLWNEAREKEPITEEQSVDLLSALQGRKQRFIEANEKSIQDYKNKTTPELLASMDRDWSLHTDSKKRYKSNPESFRTWAIDYYQKRIVRESTVWDEKEKKVQPRENDWSWTDKKEVKEQTKPKQEAINTKAPLDYIKRTGGYKVTSTTPSDIIDTFGFSAVNYGVYVDDTWSKEHTKHFLEAMTDMSEMLNIDIKKANQLGKLKIAFGAKGRKGHAAAYFPQTKDINLTRGNGDGSVAHEWGHYFDNVIVELDEHLAINKFASQGTSQDLTLRLLFKELMDFFYKGLPGITPKVPMMFYAQEKGEAPTFSTRINGNRISSSIEIKTTIEETLQQLDSYAVVDVNIYNTQKRLFGYVISAFGLETYKVPMRLKTSYVFHKSAYNFFQYCYKSEKGITYAISARTKYWSSAVELFARAWETVILKKLTDQGRMSNYLVDGISLEDVISESANRPYPTGAELDFLENMMDKIVSAVKIKYDIGDFIAPSETKEDEYLELTTTGKVEVGMVVNEETGEVDFVGAIATLEMLLEGDPDNAEWLEAVETLKILNEPEKMLYGGLVGVNNFLEIKDDSYSWKIGDSVVYSLYKRNEISNLSHIINHPILFSQYKNIGKIKIKFKNSIENSAEIKTPKTGNLIDHYDKILITINLNFDYYAKHKKEFETIEGNDPDLAKESLLLHEIQHVLQATHNRPCGISKAKGVLQANAKISSLRVAKANFLLDVDQTKMLSFYESLIDGSNRNGLYDYFYYSNKSESQARQVVREWLKHKGIRYIDPLTEYFGIEPK